VKINPAQQAGPNGDGSKSLAKESKVAVGVQLAVTAIIGWLLTYVAGLDTSSWTGILGQVGAAVVAAVAALAAAYRQPNA
jgi:hypothetical protein